LSATIDGVPQIVSPASWSPGIPAIASSTCSRDIRCGTMSTIPRKPSPSGWVRPCRFHTASDISSEAKRIAFESNRRRASASVRPITTNDWSAGVIDAGSRPAAPAASRTTANFSAYTSGLIGNVGYQPSP